VGSTATRGAVSIFSAVGEPTTAAGAAGSGTTGGSVDLFAMIAPGVPKRISAFENNELAREEIRELMALS
jgi:hypothetical protein